MSTGDFESQANTGRPPTCRPSINDGHANDLGSSFVPAKAGTDTWKLIVNAAGYSPVTMDLANQVDGTACPLGDNTGCLISLGTITMTRSGGPSPTINGDSANPGTVPLFPPGFTAPMVPQPVPPAWVPAPNVWGPAPPIMPVPSQPSGPASAQPGAPASIQPPAPAPSLPSTLPFVPPAPAVEPSAPSTESPIFVPPASSDDTNAAPAEDTVDCAPDDGADEAE
jgi:hypothetical protein